MFTPVSAAEGFYLVREETQNSKLNTLPTWYKKNDQFKYKIGILMLYFLSCISYCNIMVVCRDLLYIGEKYGISFFGFCWNVLVFKVGWSKMKNVLSAWSCLTYWPVIIILWMTFNTESSQWVTHANLRMTFFFHISSSFQCNHSIMDSFKVFWHFFICDSLFYPSTHIYTADFERHQEHLTLFRPDSTLTPFMYLRKSFSTVWISGRRWRNSKGQRNECGVGGGGWPWLSYKYKHPVFCSRFFSGIFVYFKSGIDWLL